MLYPAYHPITIVPTFRPYWSRIGDEYLYLFYAFLAMGIAAIVLWESVFPDLLDVFVLGVSPLSPQLLLRARLKAIVSIFGLVLLCVAAPGSVLLPAVAESDFFRQLVAHAVGAGTAGLSACASFIAIQSTLELLLGTRRAKRFMPALQAVGLLTLLFLLGETPRMLTDLQRGVPDHEVQPPGWQQPMS